MSRDQSRSPGVRLFRGRKCSGIKRNIYTSPYGFIFSRKYTRISKKGRLHFFSNVQSFYRSILPRIKVLSYKFFSFFEESLFRKIFSIHRAIKIHTHKSVSRYDTMSLFTILSTELIVHVFKYLRFETIEKKMNK